jgi:multiple sugar transport system substrate-binding protein
MGSLAQMTARHVFAATVAALLSGTAAFAECPADATGSVRILGNDFPALQAIAERARSCATDTLEVTTNLTTQHVDLQVPALTANPAEYSVKFGANGSMTALLTAGLLRPLDDLVARYGQDLQPSQLIRIDGQVMAIAFMANAEHFFYREDVLAEAGIAPPETWEDVIAAGEAIRASGRMQNPVALAYAPGWELGQGFVNLYLGQDGEFFRPGTAEPSINNEKGIKALETMKALAGQMDAEFLTWSSDALVPLLEADQIAMTNFWGSEASEVLPGTDKAPTVAPMMRLAAAPKMAGFDHPATTIWWDGFGIAKNIPDADAEATFRVMMHAIAPDLAQESPELAVWLIKGYQPTPAAAGVIASVEGGAPPYPTVPYMNLIHTAIDDSIVGFMQGEKTAEQALADAEAAYIIAAREAGFLQ